MLGTGNAMVSKIYNTCFLLEEEGQYLLVDGGGGNRIFERLHNAGVDDLTKIRDIIVTHTHMDHVLGVLWVIRSICQKMNSDNYTGELNVYAHDEAIAIIRQMTELLMIEKQTRFIGKLVHLIPVEHGQTIPLLGHPVTFFDTGSTKTKQFGFTMEYAPGQKLTCLGDEPYKECERPYAQGSTWLMHEAFCLHGQADLFKPYEKHHSTVRDAARLAKELQVENLLLYHTEEVTIDNRRKLYYEEARQFFDKGIHIPEDMESIELSSDRKA